MADEFNRTAFANWLVEAGETPEAAATYAGLFETFIANAFATRAHIAAVETQIAELRSEIATEARLLRSTMNKLGMFAYLRHMYFGIELAVYAVLAALLLAILWKMW